TDRHFHHDVDILGRVQADGYGLNAHCDLLAAVGAKRMLSLAQIRAQMPEPCRDAHRHAPILYRLNARATSRGAAVNDTSNPHRGELYRLGIGAAAGHARRRRLALALEVICRRQGASPAVGLVGPALEPIAIASRPPPRPGTVASRLGSVS